MASESDCSPLEAKMRNMKIRIGTGRKEGKGGLPLQFTWMMSWEYTLMPLNMTDCR